ncbi:MAG: hypothetical protein H6636_08590 [Anaerolineales bacterium]|nr:hypothetical protein [Anaerolineales bacterium]
MSTLTPLQNAILQTLTYSDLFDYPLTASEIHRYLIGVHVNFEIIQQTLATDLLAAKWFAQTGEYYTLPGREGLAETRARRAAYSANLWPRALQYGRQLAGFPFVRMVALTGTLAVNNVEQNADVDYLVITEPGRLWLCRAFVIGLVRVAARSGIILCPNFFLAENALALPDHTLYIAREITQMIPLSGRKLYDQLRAANPWVADFLPNADGPPPANLPAFPKRTFPQILTEAVFRSPLGTPVERWEMNRKIRKFTSQAPSHAEIRFSPDRCQGHFDGYGKRTMEAFQGRLEFSNGDECSTAVGIRGNS